MTPIKALEFFIKHSSHKSISAIALIAGVDPANLHACIGEKRNWSVTLLSRVSAAIGLKGTHDKLELESGLVLYLDVSGNELAQLSEAMETIAGPPGWCLVNRWDEPTAGEVMAMAVASAKGSYVVVSIRWDNLDDYCEAIDKISKLLAGVWFPRDPEAICLSQSSEQWIRMRSGIEPLSTFDSWFSRGVPRIEEWAQMLLDLNRAGIYPEQVLRIVSTIKKRRTQP